MGGVRGLVAIQQSIVFGTRSGGLAHRQRAWLLRGFGGLSELKQAPLVLPTRRFFPPTEAKGHARAEHIFGCVMEHARMAGWSCRLVAQEPRPELRVGDVTALKVDSNHAPAGTFGFSGNEVVITYDPGAVDDPMKLVATLSHELAHFKLSAIAEDPPGGPDAHELVTDLTAVYLGFGVFGANSAFNFNQHQDVMSQGWSWSRQGYLSEREWAFALAIFLELKTEPAEQLKPYLKNHLMTDLKSAIRYMRKHPDWTGRLRQIDGSPEG